MANRIYGCDQIRGNTPSKLSIDCSALLLVGHPEAVAFWRASTLNIVCKLTAGRSSARETAHFHHCDHPPERP